jgi:hypothetical protein
VVLSSEAAAALAQQHHAERRAVPAEGGLEAGEYLLLAGEGQPGAAGGARSSPISCDTASRRWTSSMISASQASIRPRSSAMRSSAVAARGVDRGGHGRSSWCGLRAGGPPGTRNAPGSSGPGRLLRRVLSQR